MAIQEQDSVAAKEVTVVLAIMEEALVGLAMEAQREAVTAVAIPVMVATGAVAATAHQRVDTAAEATHLVVLRGDIGKKELLRRVC